MAINAVPAQSTGLSIPRAETWASRLIRKGSTSSDDALTSTSAGASTPSELASTSSGPTPRFVQGHQIQPRWSDMVDDCSSEDDQGEAEDKVGGIVNGTAQDCEAIPSKTSRRKRCRRKRTGGNATKAAVAHQAANSGSNANAFASSDLRDRAAQTLADLGLLISTPENDAPSNAPLLPVEPFAYQGSVMGTAPFQSHMPRPNYSQAELGISSLPHSFVGGVAYPCYVVQPALPSQPLPATCAIAPMPSQFYR